MIKTEAELRAKLDEMLALDATIANQFPGMDTRGLIHSKVACCKTLLWALGEDPDDRWHISARPGPARVKLRRA